MVIFVNDVEHPFFGSSYGDHGVLRVVRADGGERVVLSYAGEFLHDHAGTLHADGASRCESIAGQPQDCVSVARAADQSGDDDAARSRSPRPDPALTPAALDQRMREIVREHPLAQTAQGVSGNRQAFERALAELFRRTHAR